MEFEVIFQLFLAAFLGALIGLEREIKKKEAGLQTFSLVSLGACIFSVTAFGLSESFAGKTGAIFDPLIVISAVSIGIGFLGAGVIFRQPAGTIGLTTAAGLWTTAAIGIAVAAKFYFLAVFAALLAILVFSGFGLLEKKIFK